MTHKTKKNLIKKNSAGSIAVHNGTNWIPLSTVTPGITAIAGGTGPTGPTGISGYYGKPSPFFVSGWGSGGGGGCETAPSSMKQDRLFRFVIRGHEILYTIFKKDYVKKVAHKGFGPFKRTQIDLCGSDGYAIGHKSIYFWFTSEAEHNEIKEQIYDWLYREKIIDAL